MDEETKRLKEQVSKLEQRMADTKAFYEGVLAGAEAVRRENAKLERQVLTLRALRDVQTAENERLQREMYTVTMDRNEALNHLQNILTKEDDADLYQEAASFLGEHAGYEWTSEEPEPDLTGNWMKAVREGTAEE